MIDSSEDLRAAIRALGETDPDPHKVADKLAAALTDEEAHIVAAICLPDYARHVLIEPRPTTAPSFETQSGQRVRSWKQRDLINWIEARLQKSIRVATGWKYLGDCTAADFRYGAELRRRKAAQTLAEAEEYDRYEAVMLENPTAAAFRDLPRDILAKVLG